MTVLDFITLTRRHWRMLVLGVVVGLIMGAGYAFVVPKTYVASSTGFVALKGSVVFSGTDSATSRAKSYLPLLSSQAVRDKIAQDAKIDARNLGGTLSADVVPGGQMIEVKASSSNPSSALALANGALKALAGVITDIESSASGGTNGTLEVIPLQNAEAPTAPSSPNVKLALGIGAGGGLALAYLILLFRQLVDVRVRTTNELAELSGAGILGRLPRIGGKKDRGNSYAESLSGEAFRQIRTALRFANVDKPVRSILITSANPGEGKSTIAMSVARVFAESGQPTVVIDADLRRPVIADRFALDGHVGLSEVLSGQVPLADVVRQTDDPHLFVLPSGGLPPNPSEMLGSQSFASLIEELSSDYLVIVDSAPVVPVTDSLLITAAVDGVVLVASAGKTRKADVTAARELLGQVKARVLGVVLNMVQVKDLGGGYGYGKYRQYRAYVQSNPSVPVRRPVAPEAPAVASTQPAFHEVRQQTYGQLEFEEQTFDEHYGAPVYGDSGSGHAESAILRRARRTLSR
ncbi:chromosome partitioning protein [Sinomonas cyclohexanicum]|uniref:Chromosome partitioning protein n=1 Tax=Sinomonas cyclohexanicum TaxID=322009 RepID=A0ABM7PXP5_SINCY|nr:polysaccharide biosynthesis tyrosine autokinase [Corynebacterium cyclohexanicum]BCT77050.1 chromosome partitioning protein [Corynebacterium cyclohexanicum]